MPKDRTPLASCLLVLATAAASLLALPETAPPAQLNPSVLRLPLKAESLTPPAGEMWPTYEALELASVGGGRYDLRLVPGDDALKVAGADLRLLVPRVPRLVRGNDELTRLALIQREFNRNEVHNPLPDGRDFSIANNCLERGLWEVKLARSDSGKTTTTFHAWFTFPAEEYARLFGEANEGVSYDRYDPLFARYPGVGGFRLPLDELRRVRSEQTLTAVDPHSGDELERLTEQKNKVRLLKTAGIATYGDFSRSERQPITTAKFNPPGLYDSTDTMRFDLTWLARPTAILWREVESPRQQGSFSEVEVRFANGYRVIAADAKLADLPPRKQTPTAESDVLKLVCGIGTPVIHATAAERGAEISEDRPRYLMILDSKGNHVDNHLTGVDGLYAWRDEGGLLHLWFVGYERIALVAHFSARWPQRG